MKSIFFSMFIVMFSVSLGYSQGLTIIDQDYELAKIESKKQNKLLLIDFYFVGCGPCKKLDDKVFKNPAVSNELGKSFVLLKYDIDKPTKDRLELKHHPKAFPTILTLNQNQLVFHKFIGIDETDIVKSFLNSTVEAILKVSKNEYLKGVSNSTNLNYPKFLEEFARKDFMKTNNQTEITNYWATVEDKFSEVSFVMLILLSHELPDEVKAFFLGNKDKYQELYGVDDIAELKSRIIKESFYLAIVAADRAKFDLAVKWTKENYDEVQAEKIIGSFTQSMLAQERIKKRKLSKANRQKKSKG